MKKSLITLLLIGIVSVGMAQSKKPNRKIYLEFGGAYPTLHKKPYPGAKYIEVGAEAVPSNDTLDCWISYYHLDSANHPPVQKWVKGYIVSKYYNLKVSTSFLMPDKSALNSKVIDHIIIPK